METALEPNSVQSPTSAGNRTGLTLLIHNVRHTLTTHTGTGVRTDSARSPTSPTGTSVLYVDTVNMEHTDLMEQMSTINNEVQTLLRNL